MPGVRPLLVRLQLLACAAAGVADSSHDIGPWFFADADGDGEVSEKEREIFHATFTEIDRNADGYIDRGEMRELAASLQLGFVAEELDEIMRAMAPAGSAKIPYAMFATVSAEHMELDGSWACPAGWVGSGCQNDFDECGSSPCQNGGACYDSSTTKHVGIDTFLCECATGWGGLNCQHHHDIVRGSHEQPAEQSDASLASTRRLQEQQLAADTWVAVAALRPLLVSKGLVGMEAAMATVFEAAEYPPASWVATFQSMSDGEIDELGAALRSYQREEQEPGARGAAESRGDGASDGHQNQQRQEGANEVGRIPSPTDSCSSDPCRNSGSCALISGSDLYLCTCLAGFFGTLCDADTAGNQCESKPCQNSGMCYQQHDQQAGGYSCICTEGWHGDNCLDTLADACSSEPCTNAGVCSAMGSDSYACQCPTTFDGHDCEHELRSCSSAPCANGALCTDTLDSFGCSCRSGYTSELCNINANDCASTPCLHSARCVDGLDLFTCICAAGYGHGPDGSLCGQDLDECDSDPCLHSGRCIDGPASFRCACQNGYGGDTCAQKSDECASRPCTNGGGCIDLGDGSYKCICRPGLVGTECQIDVDECASSPCDNGGDCAHSSNAVGMEVAHNRFKCQCKSGFTGLDCSFDMNECASVPCLNGGNCVDKPGDYACECAGPWGGRNCITEDGQPEHGQPEPADGPNPRALLELFEGEEKAAETKAAITRPAKAAITRPASREVNTAETVAQDVLETEAVAEAIASPRVDLDGNDRSEAAPREQSGAGRKDFVGNPGLEEAATTVVAELAEAADESVAAPPAAEVVPTGENLAHRDVAAASAAASQQEDADEANAAKVWLAMEARLAAQQMQKDSQRQVVHEGPWLPVEKETVAKSQTHAEEMEMNDVAAAERVAAEAAAAKAEEERVASEAAAEAKAALEAEEEKRLTAEREAAAIADAAEVERVAAAERLVAEEAAMVEVVRVEADRVAAATAASAVAEEERLAAAEEAEQAAAEEAAAAVVEEARRMIMAAEKAAASAVVEKAAAAAVAEAVAKVEEEAVRVALEAKANVVKEQTNSEKSQHSTHVEGGRVEEVRQLRAAGWEEVAAVPSVPMGELKPVVVGLRFGNLPQDDWDAADRARFAGVFTVDQYVPTSNGRAHWSTAGGGHLRYLQGNPGMCEAHIMDCSPTRWP